MALFSVGEKIKQRRKKLKISADRLAQQIGVSRNTLLRWESGRSVPDIEKLYSIANLLDTTFEYMVGSSIEQTSDGFSKLNEILVSTYNIIIIPIYDLHEIQSYKLFSRPFGMGFGKDAETMFITTDLFSTNINDQQFPFAVKMLNHSMSGATIEEGDLVVINPAEAVKSGDPALVVYNGTAMIRWVCYMADESIELQAASPDYKTIVVKPSFITNCEVFRIIGPAISAGKQRALKKAF